MSKTDNAAAPAGRLKPTRSELSPLLVTRLEAMGLLRIGATTLWELTTSGELPCVRLGRKVLYRLSALESYIDSLEDADDAL